MIRVVLADDHVTVRQTLRACLESDRNVEVVAEAGNGQEAIEAVRQTEPDVVLLDYRMPKLDGLAAARIIRASFPHVRIIMVTGEEDPGLETASARAGIHDFMLKSASLDRLIATVRRVARSTAPQPTVAIPDVAEFRGRG